VGELYLVLHGSVTNGKPRIWTNDDGTTVLWPPGYVARFAPALEVLDPSGVVRAREGDDLLTTGVANGLFACPAAGIGIVRIWDNQLQGPSST